MPPSPSLAAPRRKKLRLPKLLLLKPLLRPLKPLRLLKLLRPLTLLLLLLTLLLRLLKLLRLLTLLLLRLPSNQISSDLMQKGVLSTPFFIPF